MQTTQQEAIHRTNNQGAWGSNEEVPFLSPLPSRPARKDCGSNGNERFTSMGEIGRGSLCAVTQVFDRSRGRAVAIRMLIDDGISGEEALRLLQREKLLLEKINAPDCVVPIYEIVNFDGRPAQVMELASGGNLRAYQGSFGAISLPTGMAIVQALCEDVAALHRAGIVHGDIKPENIVRVGDRWKITDCTCALGPNPEDNAALHEIIPNAPLTTPEYMAPELFGAAGEQTWSKSRDVYPLGLVILELVHSPARALVREPSTPGRASRIVSYVSELDSVPRVLRLLLLACLEVDPIHRFTDATEVLDSLESVFDLNPNIGAESPVECSPQSAEQFYRGAQDAFVRTDLDHAEALSRRALASDPSHAGARNLLAELARRRHEASRLLETVRNEGAQLDLGEKLGRLDEASKLFPKHPELCFVEALVRAEAETYNRLVREAWESANQGLFEAAVRSVEHASMILPGAPGLARAQEIVNKIRESLLFFRAKIGEAEECGLVEERILYEGALDTFLSERGVKLIRCVGEHLCTIEV